MKYILVSILLAAVVIIIDQVIKLIRDKNNKRPWIKIGEIVRAAGMFTPGLYSRYVIMERIEDNGMRTYKEVFVCSWDVSENPCVSIDPGLSNRGGRR